MKPITTPIIAMALLAALPARADVHDPLNTALGALPATIFQSDLPAAFVNHQAVSMAYGSPDLQPDMLRRAFVIEDTPVQVLAFSLRPEAFRAATGFAPHALDFIARIGIPPDIAVIWGLDPAATPDLARSLADRGFTPDAGDATILVNGPVSQPDPDSPWIDATGRASAVQLDGNLVLQTWSSRALATLRELPSASDHKTGLALSEAYGHGPDLLLQAVFFSHVHASNSLLGEAFADQPHRGGMLADIQTETGAQAVMAFVFDTCAAAQALRAPAAERLDLGPDATQVFTILETDHACIAEITIEDQTGDPMANAGFEALYRPLRIYAR